MNNKAKDKDKDKDKDKELDILRNAVDEAQFVSGSKLIRTPDIQNIIDILEEFLRKNKILCYGGTAINNILPEQARFYNKSIEIPDYDFFSSNAEQLAKQLADKYYKAGYVETEAKSGVHTGTFKVFVNFIPIADITHLDSKLFNNVFKSSIKVNAINYCPPNFLRMAMYQELSRPMGDVSRWEKVLKRIILLNKYYPLMGPSCDYKNFLRKYDGSKSQRDKVYNIARECFINQGVVFFGGYAASLYSEYMPKNERQNIKNIPDFDILSEDALTCATILKEQLNYEGLQNVKIIKHKPIGEYVDYHYQILVDKDTIAFIFNTNACHSYNSIYINEQLVKVATIDTLLSFYLIFIYGNRDYLDVNRLLCISEYLFKVQLKNRLEQRGLLKRFTSDCIGKQPSLEDIKSNKSKILELVKEKKLSKNSQEYRYNFFRYIPSEKTKNKKYIKNKSNNSNKSNKTKKRKLK